MLSYLTEATLKLTNFTQMDRFISYFSEGGIFMGALLLCSLVSGAMIIWKVKALRTNKVLPTTLETNLLKGHVDLALHKPFYQDHPSVLARICRLVEQKPTSDLVEAAAKREFTDLRSGLNILEVIITIAPLLGLLGTASGLVTVFSDFGNEANNTEIARGIAMALSTTIAGLAVAVPNVIAFSYFNRLLETYAARLELILSQLVLNLK